jgi:ketosteroid isomerase-like protein
MARPSADIVREVFDLVWNRRDLAGAMALVHPDAVFDWSSSRSPYRGVFRGHDAIREASEAVWDAWEEWSMEFEEMIVVDPETVVFATHVRARGRGSGVPVEARGASVWSVRDGQVISGKLYQSKTEALASVGVTTPTAG